MRLRRRRSLGGRDSATACIHASQASARSVPSVRAEKRLGVSPVDLVHDRLGQVQAAEGRREVFRVQPVGADEEAPVAQPVLVYLGRGGLGVFLRPIGIVTSVENAVLVADEKTL